MGIDGQVSEAQMKALFGEGLHRDAEARIRAVMANGKSIEEAEASVRLGRRFPVMDHTGRCGASVSTRHTRLSMPSPGAARSGDGKWRAMDLRARIRRRTDHASRGPLPGRGAGALEPHRPPHPATR
jgi:hypothetical protein